MVAHLAVFSAERQEDGRERMALDLLPESTWLRYRNRPVSFLPVPAAAPKNKGGYSGYLAGYGYFRGRRAVGDGPASIPLERTRRTEAYI